MLGPSGAGKSTLLRVIAGLEAPDAGRVMVDGIDVTAAPPQHRRVALMFSEDALFPHLSIFENIAFALRLARLNSQGVQARVREIAEALQIEQYLSELPGRVSRGERQRASMARAVLSEPRVLLLDEPFAHLDPPLRAHLRSGFAGMRARCNWAAIWVTHDHSEAMAIADRVAVLIDGTVEQCDPPQSLYERPANLAVAAFLGSRTMNVFEDGESTLCIRPEHVRLCTDAGTHGRVLECEAVGADRYIRVQTERGVFCVRLGPFDVQPSSGDHVGLDLPERFLLRYRRSSGELIS